MDNNLIKNILESKMVEPTEEMGEWHWNRTHHHIDLVNKYANIIAHSFPEFIDLISIVKSHDKSKFESDEAWPYIFISWKYKMKQEGKDYEIPEGVNDTEATTHHVKNNPHHPEYWSDESNPINKDDRDKPAMLIDATSMPDICIAEMIADWSAVAEERGTSLIKWADNNINKRWKFTDDQVKLIYELIDTVGGK